MPWGLVMSEEAFDLLRRRNIKHELDAFIRLRARRGLSEILTGSLCPAPAYFHVKDPGHGLREFADAAFLEEEGGTTVIEVFPLDERGIASWSCSCSPHSSPFCPHAEGALAKYLQVLGRRMI